MLAILGVIIGAQIVVAALGNRRQVRLAEIDANLKRNMLDRGMAPADIEQVLRAGRRSSDEDGGDTKTLYSGREEADKAHLVRLLTDNGYSGEKIGRVLRAFVGFALEGGADRRAALIARAEAIESMVNNGSKVEEIEQVLQAFHSREAPRRDNELHVTARN